MYSYVLLFVFSYILLLSSYEGENNRSVPCYEGGENRNSRVLRDILLTYPFYNFDLGYFQVSVHLHIALHCMPCKKTVWHLTEVSTSCL